MIVRGVHPHAFSELFSGALLGRTENIWEAWNPISLPSYSYFVLFSFPLTLILGATRQKAGAPCAYFLGRLWPASCTKQQTSEICESTGKQADSSNYYDEYRLKDL
jgi:hypothetical protein